MKYFVYILYSESLKQFYTGSSANFYQRFADHNHGLSKHTRKGRPWTVKMVTETGDKTIALQLENKIKKRGARRYLEDIDII